MEWEHIMDILKGMSWNLDTTKFAIHNALNTLKKRLFSTEESWCGPTCLSQKKVYQLSSAWSTLKSYIQVT